MGKPCKDCEPPEVTGKAARLAPHPGPRCATHWRLFKQGQKERSRAATLSRSYGMRPGEIVALREAQGGRCAILGCRAKGVRKDLCLDHDHETGEPRGFLCNVHNEWVGRAGDNPAVFDSLANYLRNPPMRAIRSIVVEGEHIYYSE